MEVVGGWHYYLLFRHLLYVIFSVNPRERVCSRTVLNLSFPYTVSPTRDFRHYMALRPWLHTDSLRVVYIGGVRTGLTRNPNCVQSSIVTKWVRILVNLTRLEFLRLNIFVHCRGHRRRPLSVAPKSHGCT